MDNTLMYESTRKKSKFVIFMNNNLIAIILSLIIIGTTFYNFIPRKINTLIIYLPQIILLIYGIEVLRLIKSQIYKPSKRSKYVLLLSILFIIYYLVITIYRYTNGFNAFQSNYIASIYISSLVLYFLIDSKIINTFNIFRKLLIISSLINFAQLFISYQLSSVRFSYLLLNINVYNVAMIVMMPYFIYFVMYQGEIIRNKIWIGICWLNIFFSIFFVISSGSRSGLYLLIFTILSCLILNFRNNIYRSLKSMLPFLLIALAITLLYQINFLDLRKNMARQFISITAITDVGSFPGFNPEDTTAIKEEISGSDSVRSYLWAESLHEIEKNPLFGTGKTLFIVEYDKKFVFQGAHNVFLELSLAFGIIGMLLYFSILAIPLTAMFSFQLHKKNRESWIRFSVFLISVLCLFVSSMVEPVLSMSFPVILAWLFIGLAENDRLAHEKYV